MKEISCIMRGEGDIICDVVQKSSQVLSSSGSAEPDPPAHPLLRACGEATSSSAHYPSNGTETSVTTLFFFSPLKFSPSFCLFIFFHPWPGAKGRGEGGPTETKGEERKEK